MFSSSLILGFACLISGADPAEDAKKEIEKFRGTWKWISMESEGTKLPEATFKDSRLIMDGDKFIARDPKETLSGTFTVSVIRKPKTIDVIFDEGPEKGKVFKGIYELEGDTYKVCIALPGKDRPTEFVSKPESGQVLQVLRREKRQGRRP
jgi:uncharacterized protein (TIGR03067 family)